MNFEPLQTFALHLVPMLVGLFAVVLLDLLGGMALAWRNKTFDAEKVPQFLQNFALFAFSWLALEILGFMPIYLGLEIKGFGEALIDHSGEAAYAFVLLKYVASILKNVNAIRELAAGFDPKALEQRVR